MTGPSKTNPFEGQTINVVADTPHGGDRGDVGPSVIRSPSPARQIVMPAKRNTGVRTAIALLAVVALLFFALGYLTALALT